MKHFQRALKSAKISDYADFLDGLVRPTHYQVVQLKQRDGDVVVNRSLGVDSADIVYRDAAVRYLKNLSRTIYGRRGFRNRRSRPLPHLVTLEGDGTAVRYHLNLLLRRPEWFDAADFEQACESQWLKSPWAYFGPTSHFLQERHGDCLGYSLKDHLKKDGADCILSFSPADRS